jgi:hypothetical protein
MSRILLITTEPLPLEGWPTTGAGLRAWGLAQGLRSRGHEVALLMADDALAGFAPRVGDAPPTRELPEGVGVFNRLTLAEDPRRADCDAIVLQHWGVASLLGEIDRPLAIDLAGPHLLERRHWGSPHPERDAAEKIDALRRADFVTVSGERQRAYFLSFLAMAGWDLDADADPAPVIPFSLQADEKPAPVRPDRFIYGGFFLPWQDPTASIEIALEEMEAAGKGELVFIGGAHPRADVSRGRFADLAERLAAHPRVEMHPPMSYESYRALLREGGVALDLLARNVERELAFTTRTVQYMACGLPVIHNNYSELGAIVDRRSAGWAIDPEDRDRLREVVRGLLGGMIDPTFEAEAAHRLVQRQLNWEKTIGPLADFCAAPRRRASKPAARPTADDAAHRWAEAEAELEKTRSRLDTLLGKRWVRWGLSVFSGRALLALPLALLVSLFGVALLPFVLLVDWTRRP